MTQAAGKKKVLGGEESAPTSPFALRKRPQSILSEESATDQVLDLLEYYEIDVERIPEGEGRKKIETMLKQLVGYVRQGRLEIGRGKEARMEVTFNLSDGATVMVFGEIGAKHKQVMDRAGQNAGTYTRVYHLMASLAGLPAAAIEKLPARDLTVVEILGMVFLAA